ncbi:hypothetical protein ACTA71_008277 [Dictyostelium dimigraforme]
MKSITAPTTLSKSFQCDINNFYKLLMPHWKDLDRVVGAFNQHSSIKAFKIIMEISLLQIQKYYNEFQDIKSEIDHYYEESNDQLEKILDYCSIIEGNNNNNIGDESASSTINKSKTTIEQQQQQQQLLMKIKEPIQSIQQSIENVNNNLNKLNNLLEISKKLIHLNNLNDLNLISNRGKTKLELSVSDLIEFMTITYNNYEQDYQMKQILFDDINSFKNGNNTSNITIDKLNNTIPMWQSKPLMDLTQQQYITQRIQLFSTILKLSK